ncbi:PLP-dependent transferase [Halorubraceae archaeon YAN]|nr:PLP-dependent transferase [Halorubraceae archaeon YAN]
MDNNSGSFETMAVTYGERDQAPAPGVEDVVVPIHLSSTYSIPRIEKGMSLEDVNADDGEYLYSRLANPTRNALEHRIAALEGASHGFAVVSGTAAIATTMSAILTPGDHVVAFEDLYGGTKSMLKRFFNERLNVGVDFVDATDPENVAAAMRDETALVWMETPTNPLIHLCDIAAIAEIAHAHDAKLGVDNTFLSPYFQQPLALGADVVIHSTTKYLNGHSDSIGGAIVTDDDALAEEIGFLQQIGLGAMLSPFDSYLTLRGMKTLPLRMRQHEQNALAIARFLEEHPAVDAVHYPGLESHPQHDLACEQMDGFGGTLSLELATDLDGVVEFLGALQHFALAVSLGGVESLIEHPATMTHSPLTQAERDALGITDSLLRISVGTEAVEDLRYDLDTALSMISTTDTAHPTTTQS